MAKRATPISLKKIIILIIILLFIVAIGVAFLVLSKYKITNVIVEGNHHYSNEEIIELVMSDKYSKNSILLAFKYRKKEIKNIPFVETMDVTVLSPNSVKITVYEKALAGYVEHLGRFLYFDKDGIIVESSTMKTDGIPLVSGLQYGHVVLYEKLPVENTTIFNHILSITQLLNKYKLSADKIYFNGNYEMTLYFDEVRVSIGTLDNINEKIMKIQYILPELLGKSGILRMETYSPDNDNITFLLD